MEITGTGYGGDIAPGDNPGVQTDPIYFLANEKGTYTYCGGVQVNATPAFVSWNGTAWKVKELGLPEQDNANVSQCYGLAKVGDPTPEGRVAGDWYVFLGSGKLYWPGDTLNAPGIVYVDRVNDVEGTLTPYFKLLPFGGDRHMKGIATTSMDVASLVKVSGDYYLVVEAGDYSNFTGVTAAAVTSAGVIKYDGVKWVYTKNSGSSEGGSIEMDDTPTKDSTKAVSSGGVFTELEKKAATNHEHLMSAIKPDDNNANKIPVVSSDGSVIGYTAFTFDQIVQLAQVDMSDVNVGEKKILLAEKLADGSPSFTGAIAQLDKLGPPSLDALLDETNAAWDGDEITVTGDNQNGALGENSQEYRIGSDFFLCIAHSNGTDATNGSATWVRNRGQDSLTPGIAHDDAIIAELKIETGWSSADFKQITSKSKQGSLYTSATGGYFFMCIDKNNGWRRIGSPVSVDIEITSASHPTLTNNLAAHDFATNGLYSESSNGANETAEQGQEWWDSNNNAWYKRNMNGYWAKMN